MIRYFFLLFLIIIQSSAFALPNPGKDGRTVIRFDSLGYSVAVLPRGHETMNFRCALITLPGSGGGPEITGSTSQELTDFANSIECILVGRRYFNFKTYQQAQEFFDKLAELTKKPSLKTANFVTIGWSLGAIEGFTNGSLISRRMVAHWGGSGTFYPERKLVSGNSRLGTAVYKWLLPELPFPTLFTNGERDNNLSTSLASAQSTKVAHHDQYPYAAINVQFGQGHINPLWRGNSLTPEKFHNARDLGFPYLKAVVDARREQIGNKDIVNELGFIEYPAIPLESGWLVQEQDFSGPAGKCPNGRKLIAAEIAPYSKYKGDKKMASWLPTKEVALIHAKHMIFGQPDVTLPEDQINLTLKPQLSSYKKDESFRLEVDFGELDIVRFEVWSEGKLRRDVTRKTKGWQNWQLSQVFQPRWLGKDSPITMSVRAFDSKGAMRESTIAVSSVSQ